MNVVISEPITDADDRCGVAERSVGTSKRAAEWLVMCPLVLADTGRDDKGDETFWEVVSDRQRNDVTRLVNKPIKRTVNLPKRHCSRAIGAEMKRNVIGFLSMTKIAG
tara:strand:- start:64173 stop:64496 length:324 start_codon:yes stop_codon:yes gene_type:complete